MDYSKDRKQNGQLELLGLHTPSDEENLVRIV